MPTLSSIARLSSLACLALVSSLAQGCATTEDPATTLTIDASTDPIINAQVGGRTLRLKLDPGAPAYVLLNRSAAKALQLSGGVPATFTVGPVTLVGRTRPETLVLGTEQVTRPLLWFDHEMVDGADGVINPAHLPFRRVVMQLRPARAGEQPIILSTQFDPERGLYHELPFGPELLLTRFTLTDELTTATGATASLIARRLGGEWGGAPFTHQVRYGIRRPVRPMSLKSPLSIKGLPLHAITVRYRDDVGGFQLPAESYDKSNDRDSIVVTGKQKRRSFGEAHFWLLVGTRDLSRCSSITFEAARQRLILSCLPAPAPTV